MVALMLLLPTEATTEEKMNTCRTFYRPTTAHIPLKTTIYSQRFGFVPHILYLRLPAKRRQESVKWKEVIGSQTKQGDGLQTKFLSNVTNKYTN